MEHLRNTNFRKWLVTGALAAGAAVGAAGISAAATTASPSTATTAPTSPAAVPASGTQGNENAAHEAGETAQREADEKAGRVGGGHGPETPVTGAAADKVKAAALAAVPGTVNKTAQRTDGTYEAEITKADGTETHVSLDKNFVVTNTNAPGPRGGAPGQ